MCSLFDIRAIFFSNLFICSRNTTHILLHPMAFFGKRVIITGASGAIGAATAIRFAEQGAAVALLGRNETKLSEVKAQCLSKITGGSAAKKVLTLPCDLQNESAVDLVVARALEGLEGDGGLDVLVNSAGVLVGGPTHQTTTEVFDLNFNVNTRGPFMMLRACTPHLIKNQGSVVNISSVTGMQSFANSMAYCASKAALDMMTRCAALDLAEHKVRVNSLNPGVVRSQLQRTGGMTEENYTKFLERSKVTHPLGRVGEADEVAQAVLFLSDKEKSGFITGSILPIDGGRLCLGAR